MDNKTEMMHCTLGALALHCQESFMYNSGGCFPLTTQKAAMAVFPSMWQYFSLDVHMLVPLCGFFSRPCTRKTKYCLLWQVLVGSDCHQHENQPFPLSFSYSLIVGICYC